MSVVDTNILVHSSATTSPDHARARAALGRLAASGPIAVSRQILREFLSATTRPQPWAKAATLAEATRNTDAFIQRFTILEDGPAVWDELMKLGRASIHDQAPRDVRAFCHTLAWTGCRVSEALALTGGQVDVVAGAITFETLKKRRRGPFRTVLIPPELATMLDLVFGPRSLHGKAAKAPLWPFWPELTKRPLGTHKQTNEERFLPNSSRQSDVLHAGIGRRQRQFGSTAPSHADVVVRSKALLFASCFFMRG